MKIAKADLAKIQNGTPDEVCAVIRKYLRRVFGNTVENGAQIFASSGRYYLNWEIDGQHHGCVKRRSGVTALIESFPALKPAKAVRKTKP